MHTAHTRISVTLSYFSYVIRCWHTLVLSQFFLIDKVTPIFSLLIVPSGTPSIFVTFCRESFRLPSWSSQSDTPYTHRESQKPVIDVMKFSDSPFPVQPNDLSIPACSSVTSHRLLLSFCPINDVSLLDGHQPA